MANDPQPRIDPGLWDPDILEEIAARGRQATEQVAEPASQVVNPPAASPELPPLVTKPAAPAAAPQRFRLRLHPPPEETEELMTPAKVRSWSASFGMHVLLLVLLAIVVLTPSKHAPQTLDTRLPAGDPAGSDLGQQLTGGLGIDEPLAMPYAAEAEKTIDPVLRVPEALALAPDLTPRGIVNPADASASGGGTALTGTGQAGSGDGFGVAKFGLGGSELINNVEVKVGNPQFTLIWNTTADIDLHVLEPGGSHVSWENRRGARGAELDVDDVDGFGPENVYWGGGLNKGNGPPGEYKWYVHYYGGLDGNVPTRWKVRLKHGGAYKVFEGRLNAIGQRSKIYTFDIKTDAEGASLEPIDEPPRPEREGEAEAFEQPSNARTGRGTEGFENPTSLPAPRARRFGQGGMEVGEDQPGSPRTANEPEGRAAPVNPRTPAPARSTSARDASGWAIVQPAGAGFRVVMPVDPVEERRALVDRPGQPDVWLWSLDRGEGEFVVAFMDAPESALQNGPEARLEAEARALVVEAGGANARSEPASIDGKPGRLVEFDVPERLVAGGGRCRLRLVLDGRRLYRISLTGSKPFVERSDSNRFFESFSLIHDADTR
jgi:hypothetical protein